MAFLKMGLMNQAPTIKKVRLPRSARNDNIVDLMNQTLTVQT